MWILQFYTAPPAVAHFSLGALLELVRFCLARCTAVGTEPGLKLPATERIRTVHEFLWHACPPLGNVSVWRPILILHFLRFEG